MRQPESCVQAGAARRDITPPIGIYHRMWGAAAHDRATGIHRPLYATALVLRPLDGPQCHELAILALDHCLLWPRELHEMQARVAAAAGVPPQQVLLSFSHTHAAGLMGLERTSLPGGELIAPYLDELATRAGEALREARQCVQPAVIGYALGQCNLAMHRDMYDEERDAWVCGPHPHGPADDTLLAARITSATGKPLATVVNYACHPTTLAWENSLISPDFVGALRETVEAAGCGLCLFLQGASGDLGPRRCYVADPNVADQNGRQLGYAALAALESLLPPQTEYVYAGTVVSGALLGWWHLEPVADERRAQQAIWKCAQWQVDLPVRPGLPTAEEVRAQLAHCEAAESHASASGQFQQAAVWRARAEICRRQLVRLEHVPGGRYPLSVTTCRLGEAVWICVEAEHYQYLQRTLRARFEGTPLLVTTLTNGSLPMYLPTRETYGTGIYQETIALLAPGCLEQLADEIADKVSQLLM